jgi:hypothetical protein
VRRDEGDDPPAVRPGRVRAAQGPVDRGGQAGGVLFVELAGERGPLDGLVGSGQVGQNGQNGEDREDRTGMFFMARSPFSNIAARVRKSNGMRIDICRALDTMVPGRLR